MQCPRVRLAVVPCFRPCMSYLQYFQNNVLRPESKQAAREFLDGEGDQKDQNVAESFPMLIP